MVVEGTVSVAAQTCTLNRLRAEIFAGGIQALRADPAAALFDVIVAHVLPANLIGDLPAIVARLRQGREMRTAPRTSGERWNLRV